MKRTKNLYFILFIFFLASCSNTMESEKEQNKGKKNISTFKVRENSRVIKSISEYSLSAEDTAVGVLVKVEKYNQLGEIVQRICYDELGEIHKTENYFYDDLGNLTLETIEEDESKNSIEYSYNSEKQLIFSILENEQGERIKTEFSYDNERIIQKKFLKTKSCNIQIMWNIF